MDASPAGPFLMEDTLRPNSDDSGGTEEPFSWEINHSHCDVITIDIYFFNKMILVVLRLMLYINMCTGGCLLGSSCARIWALGWAYFGKRFNS